MSEMETLLFSREFDAPILVEFSIRHLPENSHCFVDELSKTLHLSCEEELHALAKSQFQYLQMNAVAPIFEREPDYDVRHAGDIASLYVLSRTSEKLFMKSRVPSLLYTRLNRTIYIHECHIGVLAKRRKSL